MPDSLKSILQLTAIFAAAATIVAWFGFPGTDAVVWAWRIISPLAAGGIIFLLVKDPTLRTETLPDHLAERSKRYFEAKGLCSE